MVIESGSRRPLVCRELSYYSKGNDEFKERERERERETAWKRNRDSFFSENRAARRNAIVRVQCIN